MAVLAMLAAFPASAAEHAAPRATIVQSFLAADTESRWVPFTLTPGNQISFVMAIDGKSATAMLDTGVSVSVISRAYAASAGLKVTPRGQASAIGGKVSIGWTPTRTVAFGGLIRRGGGITVTDLPAAATGSARAVDVLIGHDLIDLYALDIDYQARRFRLLKSGRLPFRGAAAPLSLSPTYGVYVSEMTIGGHRFQPMIVDSGDGASVTLSTQTWRAAALTGLPKTNAISFGLAGQLITEVALVPRIAVGKLEARSVEVRVEPEGGFSQSIGVAGRIGSGFLQRYRVLLDPAAGHIVFGATPRSDEMPMQSTSGLQVAVDGTRLEVLHVMLGSPAAAGGWKVGDTICTVDGSPIPADYNNSVQATWSIGQPGRVVTLGLCDGTTRRLTLRRFY